MKSPGDWDLFPFNDFQHFFCGQQCNLLLPQLYISLCHVFKGEPLAEMKSYKLNNNLRVPGIGYHCGEKSPVGSAEESLRDANLISQTQTEHGVDVMFTEDLSRLRPNKEKNHETSRNEKLTARHLLQKKNKILGTCQCP